MVNPGTPPQSPTRVRRTQTSITRHPLRYACSKARHAGYEFLETEWPDGEGGWYRAYRCSTCEATWVDQHIRPGPLSSFSGDRASPLQEMCGLVTLHAAGMFANVFQRHRTLAALSQEELAERAGLSRRGISEFEPGPRKLRRGYAALPAGA